VWAFAINDIRQEMASRTMSRIPLRTYLGVIYVLGLLLLLAVLAFLQYRWTGEASLAEQQRMQEVLRETLSLLERSFDGEISRAVLTFWRRPQTDQHFDPAQWRAQLAGTLSLRLEQWQAKARRPRIVQRLLIAESNGLQQPILLRLNLSQRNWEETDWPEELTGFRDLLVRQAAGNLSLEDVRRWSPQEGRFLFPFSWLPEIPAFVSPVAVDAGWPPQASRRGPRSIWGQVRLCLILYLNREYISREWLPDLARQYLSVGGQVQYDYLVRTRRPPGQLICGTANADHEGLIFEPDAAVTLLQLRLEDPVEPEDLRQLEDALREPVHSVPGGGMAPSTQPTVSTRGSAGAERLPGRRMSPIRSRESETQLRAGQMGREELPHQADQLRRAVETLSANAWQLMVKHRSGSLEIAVSRIRLRNLCISFGILLILAMSLVVFALAVRRAQQTARQQMDFVASISHELRTPVTAICSLSENLADGVVRPEEQVKRYGQLMLREGRRLGSLVEQALEFAGIRSGRRYRLRPLQVEAPIREALQACEAQLHERKAQVDTRIEHDLPSMAGDAESLSCAVQNLISNAIKYSPATVAISVQALHRKEHRRLEISVADRGTGIESGEIEHIFEPFFRGRDAQRRQIRGAGIGLSLVKRIVDAHHGQVHVASRPGEGTVFTLSFPVLEENGAEPEAG
jgi:signal transduction histidine kinase